MTAAAQPPGLWALQLPAARTAMAAGSCSSCFVRISSALNAVPAKLAASAVLRTPCKTHQFTRELFIQVISAVVVHLKLYIAASPLLHARLIVERRACCARVACWL